MSEWYPDPTGGTDQDLDTEVKGTTLARQLSTPANVKAEDATDNTDPRIKVSWDAVTAADGYEIQKWDTATSAWVMIDLDTDDNTTMATTETSYTDPPTGGLQDGAGETFYYVVRAVKGAVSSDWSGFVAGTTRPAAANLAAPSLDVEPTGQTMVRLTWEAVPGATSYDLQYAEGAADDTQFEDDRFTSTTKSLAASPAYYVLPGLKTGTRYTFRLQGVLSSEVSSEWSTETQVVTRPARPDLTATATTTEADDGAITVQIELTWDAVMLDGGHVTVRGDYEIQRRLTTGTDTSWSVDVTALTLVNETCTATVACKVVDDDVDGSTRYEYRIRVVKDDLTPADTPTVSSYWNNDTARTSAEREATQ
jgi:hypothetical protein